MLKIVQLLIGKKESHMKEIMQGASITFLLKLIGTFLAFIFNIIIARELGAKWSGIYYLALSIVLAVGVMGRLGLENITLRLVATNTSAGKWSDAIAICDKSLFLSFLASSVLSMLLFYCSVDIAQYIFTKPELGPPLRAMSLSIVPLTMAIIYSQMLRGSKRIASCTLVNGVCVPFCTILFFCLFYEKSVKLLTVSYLLSTIVAAFIGVGVWNSFLPKKVEKKSVTVSNSGLMTGATNLYLIVIVELLITWAATFILGAYGTSQEVGLFSVANRTATIISMILFSVNTIVAPKFAQLYSTGDRITMESISQRSVLIMIIVSAPVLFLFLFSPSFVMQLFGQEFAEASLLLSILAIGQFVSVSTGSVTYLLMMTGHEKVLRNIVIFVSLINIILTFFLVKYFHAVGASIATSSSTSLRNIITYFYVVKILDIHVLPFRRR